MGLIFKLKPIRVQKDIERVIEKEREKKIVGYMLLPKNIVFIPFLVKERGMRGLFVDLGPLRERNWKRENDDNLKMRVK